MSEKLSKFKELYRGTEEVYKAIKEPLVARKIKKVYRDAFDSADAKIIDLEIKIQEARKNFDRYDLNFILEANMDIEQLKEQQKAIAEDFKFLFDAEMKVWDE